MASREDIFIGILASLDYTDDVVVLHGAAIEVVADVELELEYVLTEDFFLDHLELGLVKDYVADGRQVLHCDVVAVGAVIHHPERNRCGRVLADSG